MIGRGCFRRSSSCMASRRPARVGGGRPRRWRDAIARWSRTSPATVRRCIGRRASTPAPPTSARSRRRRPFTLAGYSMGGRIALHSALTLGPATVTRLVLVGASPGLADPAERAARRAADDALADRIETLDDRGLRPRVGRPAAVRRPARARRRGRARRPAAQHARGPRRRAARARDRRDGAALGAAAGARDPRHARRRRARREVPRARRGDARAATGRAAGRRGRRRPCGPARERRRRWPRPSTSRGRPLRRPRRSRRPRSPPRGGRRTRRRRA